jgi:hypothetical protein
MVGGTAGERVARFAGCVGAITLVAALGWLALVAGTARAGTWVQVSCVNPNGSAASSEGWSGATSGPFATGGSATTSCGPGNPLIAAQNVVFGTPPSVGSTETLTYTPPAGSTLAGGSVDVALEAYGYGPSNAPAFTDAAVLSPQPQASDIVKVVACAAQSCSGNVMGPTVLPLPAGQGGTVSVAAGCGSIVQSSNPCSQTNNPSVYDVAHVYSADLLLSTNAQPQASGFHGSALQRNASGTAALVFSASDPVGSGLNPPSGPGIYAVTVQIDGHTVFAGTPNSGGGACSPVGGGAGQPLMFDGQQPCPPAETVDAPVPTGGLPDGRHRLTVALTDAAGNIATVFDQYISTANPQLTPVPRGRGRVRARFKLSWRWNGTHTTLLSVRARNLPRTAAVSILCRGRGCGHAAIRARGARGVSRALRGLDGRRFRAGDRLYITVTAPARRAERILLRIRNGRIPTAQLIT